MSRKRKEKPIAPGDAVTVLRHCADGAARMARGVVEFAYVSTTVITARS